MAPAGPSLNMKPVLIGAGILALAGLGAFAAATRHAAPGLPQGARQIAVSETACEPMAMTVPPFSMNSRIFGIVLSSVMRPT